SAHLAAIQHKVPSYYDDFKAMYRSAELHAVTIAAPPEVHHAAAVAAAERRLHILCEKPMAVSGAEARDMYRLVRDAGIQHAVDYESRFTPARREVKRLVEGGYIGRLCSVNVTVYRPDWRDRLRHSSSALDEGERSAGVLGAIGSDYIDSLRWWFGEIEAVAGAAAPDGANYAIALRFAGGAVGTIHLSAISPVALGDEVVAMGTDGMLALRADGRLFGTLRHQQCVTELPIESDLGDDLPKFPDPRLRPFVLLAREWVRGIRTGESSAPTFEDGMKVQEVIDSVRRSQDLGRWIDTSGKKWPM
ncbi:MAG: Gfo/Idh/MocA family oxidoreductase, partial [Thermomicrobiaceae bacterium]|nr:Gfo/Idh/MocA family oxidoreductase [Thermomicrobiaceae bacterium]